ncbi:MAG: hypothetical protein QNK70_05140 [Crocinitomicaceae bacterium]
MKELLFLTFLILFLNPSFSQERYSDIGKADTDFRNNKINLDQFPLNEAPPFGQFSSMEKNYVNLFKERILKSFHDATNKNETMSTDIDNGYIFYFGSTPRREDGYVVLNSLLLGPLGYTSQPDTLSDKYMLGKIEFREMPGTSFDDRLKKIISDLYQGKVKNEEVFDMGRVSINCYLKTSNAQKQAENKFSYAQPKKPLLLKPVKLDTVWKYDQTQRIDGKINGVYFEGTGYAFADAILSNPNNLWKTDYHPENISYKKQDLNSTAKWAELIPFGLFKEFFLRPASFRKRNQRFELELDLTLTYFDVKGMKGAACLVPNIGVFNDTTLQYSSVDFKFKPKNLLQDEKPMWPIGHSRDQNLLYETFLDNCVAQYKQYLKDPSVYTKKSYGPSGGGQSKSASVSQCSGRTLKGARCRRRTTSSSGRCFQH